MLSIIDITFLKEKILRTLSFALVTALAIGVGSNAMADSPRCPAIAAAQWMPIEKAVEKAEMLGYAVSEAKRSKGCWKIKGHDRAGAKIKIYLDPASGDIVKSRHWRQPAGR